MSELMNAHCNGRDFRWRLLTTVSTLALLAAVCGSSESHAEDQDTDRPTVWIELGGQLEQMRGGQEPFAPAFVANLPSNFFSPLSVQKPLQYSIGGEGALSIEPEGSDWVFSASLRFGRSNGIKQQHQQTQNAAKPIHIKDKYGSYPVNGSFYPNLHLKFADATAKQSETHTVLDFQAGKDVGLGIFGNLGSSVLSAGVRFAQFTSKSSVNLHAQPDVHYTANPIVGTVFTVAPAYIAWKSSSPIHFHDYAAMETNQRSFRGLGPSLAWKASAPFAGNPERGEITLDWGANAAVLFGRQKASGHHQTTVKTYHYNKWKQKNNGCAPQDPCQKTGHFYNNVTNPETSDGNRFGYTGHPFAHHSNAANFDRTRLATVPNLGAFAGLSYRYADAKISLGYRADFFFGAMDGGIDTRQSENRGFFGPFATISIGFP